MEGRSPRPGMGIVADNLGIWPQFRRKPRIIVASCLFLSEGVHMRQRYISTVLETIDPPVSAGLTDAKVIAPPSPRCSFRKVTLTTKFRNAAQHTKRRSPLGTFARLVLCQSSSVVPDL